MKSIVTILFLLIGTYTYSQDTTVCYTGDQILNISNHIKDLEQKDSINTLIIDKYKTQLNNYKTLSQKDSVLLYYKEQEVQLLKQKVDVYQDLVKATKPKWYERKFFMYLAGMGTVWGTLYVSQQIQ